MPSAQKSEKPTAVTLVEGVASLRYAIGPAVGLAMRVSRKPSAQSGCQPAGIFTRYRRLLLRVGLCSSVS